MSWLDNMICVPAIGVQVVPDFRASANYRHLMAPLAEEIQKEYGSARLSFSEAINVFLTSDNDGFLYRATLNELAVEYKYKVKEIKTPGQFPVFKEIDARAYTDLLDLNVSRIINLIDKLSESCVFQCKRIGIVAEADTTLEAIPPGISDFLSQADSMYRDELDSFKVDFTGTITRNEDYTERCIHALQYDGSGDSESIRIRMDWQRIFIQQPKLDSKTASKNIIKCKERALQYFQSIGEEGLVGGSNND